ncbi:MAG: hypothetical protein ACLGH4_09965, partial [Actinomycetes bacterium]
PRAHDGRRPDPRPGGRRRRRRPLPYWLDPKTLHQAVAASFPEARLATEGEPWLGPPEGIVDEPPDEAAAALLDITGARLLAVECGHGPGECDDAIDTG